jgi:hypothetical protein
LDDIHPHKKDKIKYLHKANDQFLYFISPKYQISMGGRLGHRKNKTAEMRKIFLREGENIYRGKGKHNILWKMTIAVQYCSTDGAEC